MQLTTKLRQPAVLKHQKPQGDHHPVSRQCEIARQFQDISLTVHDTPAHVKCYSYHADTSVVVSGGGRNETVYDPKPK